MCFDSIPNILSFSTLYKDNTLNIHNYNFPCFECVVMNLDVLHQVNNADWDDLEQGVEENPGRNTEVAKGMLKITVQGEAPYS